MLVVTCLQSDPKLKPDAPRPLTSEETESLLTTPPEYIERGKECIKSFVEIRFPIVQSAGENDLIAVEIAKEEFNNGKRKCFACGVVFEASKRKVKCDSCKSNLKKAEKEAKGSNNSTANIRKTRPPPEPGWTMVSFNNKGHEIQKKIDSEEQPLGNPNKVEYWLQDPIFLNPGSEENLLEILRKIGKDAGIRQYGTGTREWVWITVDGSPYKIICKLIANTKDDLGKHEFLWIRLREGLFHEEFNMQKAIIDVNFDVIIRDFANVSANYTSEKAQKTYRKASDKHKGRDNLITWRQAMIDELIYTYVFSIEHDKDTPVSVDSF
eukprot:Lithocolla_globosa_v1_NODE_610_length_3609_cov_4.771525.p2 type:complete len:324 gc:universal NODE_610_length_3609_cov_4.771525:2034-1063(-)